MPIPDDDLFTPDRDNVYLLSGVDLEVHISHVGSLIHFHHNGSTKSFSLHDATQIGRALVACASGAFDVAATETYLRLSAEREARRRQIASEYQSQSPTPSPAKTPDLGDL